MNEAHTVSDIGVVGKKLHMVVDGVAYTVDLSDQTKRLRDAPGDALSNIEVSPSGYGLHWPDLDEDMSIDGLIGVRHEVPLAVAESREQYGL